MADERPCPFQILPQSIHSNKKVSSLPQEIMLVALKSLLVLNSRFGRGQKLSLNILLPPLKEER